MTILEVLNNTLTGEKMDLYLPECFYNKNALSQTSFENVKQDGHREVV